MDDFRNTEVRVFHTKYGRVSTFQIPCVLHARGCVCVLQRRDHHQSSVDEVESVDALLGGGKRAVFFVMGNVD